MRRLIDFSDRMLRWLLIVVASALVLCVTWQVFSRYVLPAPSTVTEELGRFLLMWFALLAAAYVLGQRRHLAIDLFAHLAPGPAKRFLSVVLTLIIAAFVILTMIAGGWLLSASTLSSGQVTPTLRMPMGYVYLVVPISGVLMLLYCMDILRTALGPDARGPNDHATDPRHPVEDIV